VAFIEKKVKIGYNEIYKISIIKGEGKHG